MALCSCCTARMLPCIEVFLAAQAVASFQEEGSLFSPHYSNLTIQQAGSSVVQQRPMPPLLLSWVCAFWGVLACMQLHTPLYPSGSPAPSQQLSFQDGYTCPHWPEPATWTSPVHGYVPSRSTCKVWKALLCIQCSCQPAAPLAAAPLYCPGLQHKCSPSVSPSFKFLVG